MIRVSVCSFLVAFSSLCFATPDISLLDDLQRENLLNVPAQTAFISTPRATKTLVGPAKSKATNGAVKSKKSSRPARKKRLAAIRQKNTQYASLKKQNNDLKSQVSSLREELERLKSNSCMKTPTTNVKEAVNEGLFKNEKTTSQDSRKVYTLNTLKYDR